MGTLFLEHQWCFELGQWHCLRCQTTRAGDSIASPSWVRGEECQGVNSKLARLVGDTQGHTLAVFELKHGRGALACVACGAYGGTRLKNL